MSAIGQGTGRQVALADRVACRPTVCDTDRTDEEKSRRSREEVGEESGEVGAWEEWSRRPGYGNSRRERDKIGVGEGPDTELFGTIGTAVQNHFSSKLTGSSRHPIPYRTGQSVNPNNRTGSISQRIAMRGEYPSVSL
jgi:hypothetical protein